jgi:hypothetical protein
MHARHAQGDKEVHVNMEVCMPPHGINRGGSCVTYRVTQQRRDGEGRNFLGASGGELESLLLVCLHASKGRADHNSEAGLVDLAQVDA